MDEITRDRPGPNPPSFGLPSFDLSGEVAFVTGASSGIGRHIAAVLAAAGAKVALAARRIDRLTEIAREIEAAGGRCLPVVCDVTSAASVAAAVAGAETELGPLSILVNNSGVVVSKPVLDHTEEDWDYVLDTNLKGAWLVSREFARHLVALNRPGNIINVSSILATRTIKQVPAYAASKAGLSQLTQVMAMELARSGIRVNAIAPGYVVTELNQEFLRSDVGKALERRIPMRRIGDPADLDGALLLLASPAGAYITGAIIPIDGGHSVAAI